MKISGITFARTKFRTVNYMIRDIAVPVAWYAVSGHNMKLPPTGSKG